MLNRQSLKAHHWNCKAHLKRDEQVENTPMKMPNYTSSAGRVGILIFALVKYAIFSLKSEKKTRDFVTTCGMTPMSSAVELLI